MPRKGPAAKRPIVIDQALEETSRFPVIEDVADIEDDGRRRSHPDQPWRALNLRLVLLMT